METGEAGGQRQDSVLSGHQGDQRHQVSRYKVKALYGSKVSPLMPEEHRYRVVPPEKFSAKSTTAKKLTATWSANTKAAGY